MARQLFALLLASLSLLRPVLADTPGFVKGVIDGKEYLVREDRQPALYTGDFGDCTGGSSVNVTRFDAAYYKDNMTIIFHLGGDSALKNETIMSIRTVFIGVYAYGEARFDLTFDPCKANIYSACPVEAGTPIEASGIIPVGQSDVAGIPPLALEIPDFEGQAILRIFSNNTQSQIGCYTAVLTNGNSFSHPDWVGSIIGVFTGIALLSSFATAIYGDDVTEMRKHYAHSLSVGIVFAVWQHIYFSGALSMNWPSVLVSFWSNYAWAGGMIYSEQMQNTINNFIGVNKGNTSAVGAAASGVENPGIGGGYDIHSIYKRRLYERELADSSNGFSWYGNPVKPGIPLPGNYSGFAGTLAQQNIPASNAFMTGFLWFLILVGIVAGSVLALKLLLEAMSKTRMMKSNRLTYFRAHYLGYTMLAVLRTMSIGYFMIMFLTLFQFTYLASPAPVAVACIVFLIMLIGLGGLAGYACFYRLKFGNYVSEPNRLNIVKKKVLKVVPWHSFERNSEFPRSEDKKYAGSLPWWSIRSISEDKSVHDAEVFTKKFGWLASRFRRTRWWFFVVWLVYEFTRAGFLAGASTQPMVQVFGLLAVEFIAFIGIAIMRPFEGQRLNVIVVYLLGFSKVATAALSAAFDHRFGLERIPATVIGIVIIVIQGVLTIMVLVAIMLGAITSYMSVMRNRETIRPTGWTPIRAKYFKHMDFKVLDIPRPPSPPPEPKPEPVSEPAIPKEPYFKVTSIKRVPKVEDEDAEFLSEIQGDFSTSQLSLTRQSGTPYGRSRAPSLHSQVSFTSLPQGVRVHRASWSAADFSENAAGRRRTSSLSTMNTPEGESRPTSGTIPLLSARVGSSSENISRQPSPLATNQPITPTKPSSTVYVSPGPIPRPKSRASGKSPASRPQLRTVLSEDEIPPLPMKDPRAATNPFATK
ncbi:TRP-domain-containing protein [Lentithecium fluviatile CBS 122367]|uniref:TRP-domain-containing protein n=1 Tax=Lentithecium fluviatile CBS 122367 TaxID=1168545 RepID=A0A6G1JGZ1_9PLEO|nr:TRP-domain-containing protein [Lentithecium fluviatile CBS 122367]